MLLASKAFHVPVTPRSAFETGTISFTHSGVHRRTLAPQQHRSHVLRATGPSATASVEQTPKVAAPPLPQSNKRVLAIAVDDTADAREALEWLLEKVARPGDSLKLLHVISDPRSPSTAVGSMGAGSHTQWSTFRSSNEESYGSRQSYMNGLQERAAQMISRRFGPALKAAGAQHEVVFAWERGTKSAAGIGEAICGKAKEIEARMLFIASHGRGVLAEYGSVAKYCSDNAGVPVLMMPPASASLEPADPEVLLVVALADLPGLEEAVKFGADNLLGNGERVSVLFVPDQAASSGDAAGPTSAHRIELAVQGVLERAGKPDVPIDVQILAPGNPGQALETVDMTMDVGPDICKKAQNIQAKSVLLLHHGKGMIRDLIFGSVTSHTSRNCKRPLMLFRGKEIAS
ncbi:hypothetical protein WJX84_011752 [Apatococcus fuscideae]|uniref:UspA domain-containing protein n=1 Tax=Apatococcus fuscideae TaxID=2026836 RepID=A0AAW1T5K1_9CHLO